MSNIVDEVKQDSKSEDYKSWISKKPYWEKYLWWLHLNRETLTDSDIDHCYRLLLEDSLALDKTSIRSDSLSFEDLSLTETTTPSNKIVLSKIKNLKNVNALDDNVSIVFGKNLTVVYGDNGVGKSGIGRLLSNACQSRKPRKVLPNAKKVIALTNSNASADIYVTDQNGERLISYKIGDIFSELKCFSVFDNESAPIHLNNENEIKFVPSQLHIFDDVFKSICSIEKLFQLDIERKTKDNPTEEINISSPKILSFLNSLSYKTKNRNVDKALFFTSQNQSEIDKLKKIVEEKLKLDTTKRKLELLEECNDLTDFLTKLHDINSKFNGLIVKEINFLIKEINEKKEIAAKLSSKNFEFSEFKNIGGQEWKSLILAAKKLYDLEKNDKDGVLPKFCLLCRQEMGIKEEKLFKSYWEFLGSTAEAELTEARRKLNEHLLALKSLETTWPQFLDTEIAIKILKRDSSEELDKIIKYFELLKNKHTEWIKSIKDEKNVVFTEFVLEIKPIDLLIKAKKQIANKLIDQTATIKVINLYISFLEEKRQVSSFIEKIKEYLSFLRWQNAISGINLPAIRANITRKKNEIMDELVISEYIKIFNEESNSLDCDFGLKVESHGKDANTIKELRLDFARGYNPSDILSEGEQTVGALADFLTEARINKNNSGIIFDDPVNSLDHERKSIIAKRLGEEAKKRQVIILTHDIIFLFDLLEFADKESLEFSITSMRKNGDQVGLVKNELPWLAQNVKSRVGCLKNELASLKKLESEDQDKYRFSIKSWYGLLYEAWERAIEERLFKGVIVRFRKSIEPLKLNSVQITPELKKKIYDAMTEASNWRHDTAASINPSLPKYTKLESDWGILDNFVTNCKPS
ncbi:MAG: hypothetical protein V1922_03975 [bacterium]